MKYNNKDDMRNQAIQLYLNGKNYIEIAKILSCSRNYVSKTSLSCGSTDYVQV